MRILIVAPCTSPRMAVGAKRMAFLARHWEQSGHDVETIARRIMNQEARDHSLPKPGCTHWIASMFPPQLPGRGLKARIYNRMVISLLRLGMPDSEVGWLLPAYLTGRSICERFKPDAIVATGPPFTPFLVGALLSRRSGSPLVLDYRDPWTAFDWPDNLWGRLNRSNLRKRLERWTVQVSSAAIFTSNVMLHHFGATFGSNGPAIRAIITNGFNEEENSTLDHLSDHNFNLLYCGNMHGERKLSNLALGLALLIRRGLLLEQDCAIHILGNVTKEDRRRMIAKNVWHLVREHRQVEHRRALEFMRGADCLFLPSGGDVPYALPFKTFDYLSARKPILAVAPSGSAVASLMDHVDCGEISNQDEPSAIADALERLLQRRYLYSYRGREDYLWPQLALRYLDVLERVTPHRFP